jgi:DNA-binding CsgD family transcriptional regulator
MCERSPVYLDEAALRAIARIWGELAAFPAARADDAMKFALAELARALGASNAFWVGARHAPAEMPGKSRRRWEIVGTTQLVASAARDRSVAIQRERYARGLVDPQTLAIGEYVGTHAAFLRRDLVEDAVWNKSWLVNDVLRPLNVGDRLLGTHAIDETSQSYIGLERETNARPFGARERDFLAVFLTGASAFHREALRLRSSSPPLTPRERAVLSLLLTAQPENEIARELGLTPRTTHQYVVSILHKFGVRARRGLMAYFLRDESAQA